MIKHRTVFHWSGGKDSSIALHKMMQSGRCSVELLFTTLNSSSQRVTMHGVYRKLIERQAREIGLPLSVLELPDQPGMAQYDQLIAGQMKSVKERGITHAAFGDINLEDLKQYRESQMEKAGLKSVFPVWGVNTKDLVHQFIHDGFKAVVVSVQADKLGKEFAGREVNQQFLDDLPADVDPCGENGEFHTFVYDGPIFENPIQVKKGEIVYREYDAPGADTNSAKDKSRKMGFWFCDLVNN
jgi:uncharacterized protein (TIGR00290 family)